MMTVAPFCPGSEIISLSVKQYMPKALIEATTLAKVGERVIKRMLYG
jgi:hypothetical protein